MSAPRKTVPAWPFPSLRAGSFDIVAIDPPWPWKSRTIKGYAKSPNAHYRVMSWGQIADLPVRSLLRPGGAVVVWCCWPMIAMQTAIIERDWGLVVKTGGAWAKRTRNGKLRWGPGFVLRSVCEPFLIATDGRTGPRGRSAVNLIEATDAACVDGLAREHSRKPDEFYRTMEQLTPGARRADVFGRTQRPGWTVWGDQTAHYPPAQD